MRTDGYIELEIYYVELTGHIASFMNLSNLFSVKPVELFLISLPLSAMLQRLKGEAIGKLPGQMVREVPRLLSICCQKATE